jgi:hypothetical protein
MNNTGMKLADTPRYCVIAAECCTIPFARIYSAAEWEEVKGEYEADDDRQILAYADVMEMYEDLTERSICLPFNRSVRMAAGIAEVEVTSTIFDEDVIKIRARSSGDEIETCYSFYEAKLKISKWIEEDEDCDADFYEICTKYGFRIDS